MTAVAAAMYGFFSSFGIPAYAEHSLPDNAAMPYITYSPVEAPWDGQASVDATLWYGGTSLKELFAKVDEIKERVGEGCLRIPAEGGSIQVYMDSPFSQMQPAEEDEVKAVHLLFGMHCLCS